MKKVKSIEKWIKGYEQVRRLADELQLAFDYHKEELVTEEEVDADYTAAINAIENQKYDPSLPLAFQLARILGTTVDALFLPKLDA